jgi:hypothetical protein
VSDLDGTVDVLLVGPGIFLHPQQRHDLRAEFPPFGRLNDTLRFHEVVQHPDQRGSLTREILDVE